MADLGDKEKNLYFREGMLDENPTFVFVKAINKVNEGKEEEAVKEAKKIADNLDFLVEKALDGKISGIRMSKRTLMNTVIKLILLMDCELCIRKIVKRNYEDVELAIAFMRHFNDKKLVEWIKNMLKENSVEILYVLKNMGKKDIEVFFEDILRIAKNEVDTPQYVALEILAFFDERKEVIDLFKTFASDWDKTVRKIAVLFLSKKAKDKEIKELLEEAIEDEREESIKFIIKTALKNIKEGKDEK